MTSLFAHPPYAEDQPSSHAILYTHVVRASAMTFSFLALSRFPIALVRARYRRVPINLTAIGIRTLHNAGRGLVLGSVAGVLATWGRMRGREEIEWQDRAWRILENEGEVKTDWVALGGVGAGAVAGFVGARRGLLPGGVVGNVLGGAGVGSAVGVPFMVGTYVMGRKPA